MSAGRALGVTVRTEDARREARFALPVRPLGDVAALASFTPPANVTRLVIFAGTDVAEREAVRVLTERLQGRVRVESRPLPATAPPEPEPEARRFWWSDRD